MSSEGNSNLQQLIEFQHFLTVATNENYSHANAISRQVWGVFPAVQKI
jgi:hypothetical protein